MTLRITCMDGRKFLSEKSFKTHVEKVHTKDQLLFAKFDDKSTVTIGVPYRAPLDVAGDNVDHEKNECSDCKDNSSAARLPVHPGCGCAPAGGWTKYISGLERPDDVADDMWNGFLKFLDQAKKGKI